MAAAALRSISALLKGMEKRLRVALEDQPAEAVGKLAGVKPDGRPPNNCGQWYYAIHFMGLSGIDQNALSNDKEVAASVTITRRMGQIPKDRKGSVAASADEILDQADWVADLFHQDETTREYANDFIGATVQGYTTPLKLQSISQIQEVGAEWVGGDSGAPGAEKNIFTVTVNFGGAELVKYIGE